MTETLGQKQRRFMRTDPHELSTSALVFTVNPFDSYGDD